MIEMVDGIICSRGKTIWSDCLSCKINCISRTLRSEIMRRSYREPTPPNAHGITSLLPSKCLRHTYFSKSTPHFQELSFLLMSVDDGISQSHETALSNNFSELSLQIPVTTDDINVYKEGPWLHPEHAFITTRIDFYDPYSFTLFEKKTLFIEKNKRTIPRTAHYQQLFTSYYIMQRIFRIERLSLIFHIRGSDIARFDSIPPSLIDSSNLFDEIRSTSQPNSLIDTISFLMNSPREKWVIIAPFVSYMLERCRILDDSLKNGLSYSKEQAINDIAHYNDYSERTVERFFCSKCAFKNNCN